MTTVPSADELAAAWARWHAEHLPEDRQFLADTYTRLVRRIAANCYLRRASRDLEFADFVQHGIVGLLESIDRYRPERGAKFETFATHRIEGAILNGVQSLSELQQQVTTRRRIVQERSRSIAEAHQGDAGKALERLAEVAIGLALGFALEDSGLYAGSEQAMPDNAYARTEMKQLRARVAELVEQLPEQERFVIHRHYFQQVRFDEIAAGWGVTKGRVSQVHHAALARLRALL